MTYIPKIISITSVLLVLFLGCSQRKTVSNKPKGAPISAQKLVRLNKVMHKFVDNEQIAGIQTAILKNDSLIHFESYGYANKARETLLDSSSIFRIFSMTKPITSVALMQLYEQGKFELDDPVSQYIPEFKNMTVFNDDDSIVTAQQAIKIIDLLRHTSGISYGRSPNPNLNKAYAEANLGHSENLKAFIKNISQLPLAFEPGTDYEYGYSTDICGYLIEVLSGQSIDEYIKKNILDPLHMKDTHFQLPKEKLPYFTTGYRPNEDGKIEVADLPETSRFLNQPNFIRAGGGLVSTTKDYLNFCRMLLHKGSLFGHQIIMPETLDLMTTDHLKSVREHTTQLRILNGETGFGLGFSLAEREGKSIVYGWAGAAGTYFRVDPKQDLAYIMMIQLSPHRQLNLGHRFQELVYDVINQ